jgi:hypothetical protein
MRDRAILISMRILKLLLLPALLVAASAYGALAPEPIDLEIEKIKPRPGDSVAQAQVKCEKLAEDSRRNGIKTLLIGIEGQGGFAEENTWLVYRYLWRITHGTPDQPPTLNNLAPVLHRLLLPLIDHYRARVEILNFSELEVRPKSGGAPEACAAAWLARRDQPRVVLIGHSFGADAIHDLAQILEKRGLPVEQAYSLDAIAKSAAKRFTKPANVGFWLNFYQRNGTPFGQYVRGAQSNRDLSSHGVNHRTIVRSPPVIAAIKENLEVP